MGYEADDDAADVRCVAGFRAVGGACALPELVPALLSRYGVELRADTSLEEPSLGLLWFEQGLDDALAALRAMNPNLVRQIMVVTAGAGPLMPELVWKLMSAGAADVVPWPRERDVNAACAAVAARMQRWHALEKVTASEHVARLVGRSPAWRATVRQLVEAAAFTDLSILLTGESGVGKEEAARLVHLLDARAAKKSFVVLDCTTVVPELSGSEFFGHERGAFTGASSPRDGAFALADGGTLFLDEVGELPPALQAQLLRVIQERTYKRVGANVWHRTSFRLVCATNRDLADEVACGRFRRDLYHRIASWTCHLPSLKERPSDILLLARHFLREVLPAEAQVGLDPAIADFLLRRDYPGNVRELRQLVLRIGKRHVGPGPVTVGALPAAELRQVDPARRPAEATFDDAVEHALALGMGLKELGRAASEAAIRVVLRDEAGNLQRAARRLGVTDRALQIRRAQRTS